MKHQHKLINKLFGRRARRRALAKELREASLQAVHGDPALIDLYFMNSNHRAKRYQGPTTA